MDKRSKSKYLGLAGLGVIAAATVAYFSTLWPPATYRNVQGAVGKREVYRDPQLSDKDVGVAGKGSVTVDDIKRLVESQAFRSLANNQQFAAFVANGQAGAIANIHGTFMLGNQNLHQVMKNAHFIDLTGNATFTNMLKDAQFAQALAGGSDKLQPVLQQYGFENNPQVAAVVQNTSFQNMIAQMQQMGGVAQFAFLFTNSDIQNLVGNVAFAQVAAMPGFAQVCALPAVQQLASQGQLANFANNASVQASIIQQFGSAAH